MNSAKRCESLSSISSCARDRAPCDSNRRISKSLSSNMIGTMFSCVRKARRNCCVIARAVVVTGMSTRSGRRQKGLSPSPSPSSRRSQVCDGGGGAGGGNAMHIRCGRVGKFEPPSSPEASSSSIGPIMKGYVCGRYNNPDSTELFPQRKSELLSTTRNHTRLVSGWDADRSCEIARDRDAAAPWLRLDLFSPNIHLSICIAWIIILVLRQLIECAVPHCAAVCTLTPSLGISMEITCRSARPRATREGTLDSIAIVCGPTPRGPHHRGGSRRRGGSRGFLDDALHIVGRGGGHRGRGCLGRTR